MRLEDRVAIVTGASRGIGRAVAIGLAKEGAHVMAVGGSDAPAIEEVADLIRRECNRRSLARVADVSSRPAVDQVVAKVLEDFGRIDILVTCAGVIAPTKFLSMTEEQWDRTMAVNLKGTFHCIQAVLPHMLAQGSGKIVTVTGPAALRASPNGVADYGASKAGIIALTRIVARELQDSNTRISLNCVSPVAQTRMIDAMAEFQGMTREQFGASHPLGHMPPPEAVVPTFVFLASDDADYLTGQVIAVDSGRTN
jgi:3-oxoacyl-[acyl-carrier protein] reductase